MTTANAAFRLCVLDEAHGSQMVGNAFERGQLDMIGLAHLQPHASPDHEPIVGEHRVSPQWLLCLRPYVVGLRKVEPHIIHADRLREPRRQIHVHIRRDP